MLKQRIITALVLGVVFVGLLIGLPAYGFGCLLLLVVLLAAWEWTHLLQLSSAMRLFYCLLLLALIVVLWWWPLNKPQWLLAGVLLASLFWCFVVYWLHNYSRRPNHKDKLSVLQATGIIVLTGPWLALMSLRSNPLFGIDYVLFLLFMIWFADSGAYFAGRYFGRRKLAVQISPGKTWEGAFGALFITVLVAIAGLFILAIEAEYWFWFVVICLITVSFSIIGDLFESMIKRQRGVKDSGSLLPGHGGVLDRVDSLTAAAPLFLAGLLIMFAR